MTESVTIIDNKAKKNIELGAGCGTFGYNFIADCYITEFMPESQVRKNCEKCYVELFNVDANDLKQWQVSDRFNEIWMCNPNGYGFKKETTEPLMKELCRVITNNGKIVIISNERNSWATPDRINKFVKSLNFSDIVLTIGNIEPLQLEYHHHIFKQSNLEIETKPNFQLIIHVSKQ